MGDCDPAWLSSEEQHRCLDASGQFPTAWREEQDPDMSELIQKKDTTRHTDGPQEPRRGLAAVSNSCFLFLNAQGITEN